MDAQHSLVKLPWPVNTPDLDEICPVVSYDESKLYFTRVADPNCEKTLIIDKKDIYMTTTEDFYFEKLREVYSQLSSGKVENPLLSGFNQDIWFTNINNDNTDAIFHPGYPINDVLPNSICSNYGKSNTFIVLNQFAPEGGIGKGFSVTRREGEFFTFPTPITIDNFNVTAADVNVTASIDSSVLILSLFDKKGFGEMDLYVSFRIGTDHYSEPINLGQDINTIYRESTPMLTHDIKRLYFTSDRTGGYGGKDIYFTDRKDFTFTKWTTPVKLNPPVNTPFDDSHPHLMKNGNGLFFTSNRDGSSDIFKAMLNRVNISEPLLIKIKIINGETGRPSPGEILWGDAYQLERPGYFRSKDGLCSYKFYENKPVAFKAINRNKSSAEIILDLQELINLQKSDHTLELILLEEVSNPVPKINNQISDNKLNYISEAEIGSKVQLNNIYFEKTKPSVLPQSYPSLGRLADILKTQKDLIIKIIGHTDNVGDKDALMKLSKDRADAIKMFLVDKGIPSARVYTAGYGDTQPITTNDTEENKSKNRRVEIKILSK